MEWETSKRHEPKTHANASSQYRGVSFNNHSQKWKAVITVGRKQFFLGYFALESEAARAYDKASIDLRGPDAPTNFRYDPAAIQAFAIASAQHKAQLANNSAASSNQQQPAPQVKQEYETQDYEDDDDMMEQDQFEQHQPFQVPHYPPPQQQQQHYYMRPPPASLEKLDSQTNDSVESVRDVEMELNAIRATLMQRGQQPPQQMRNGKDIPAEYLCL